MGLSKKYIVLNRTPLFIIEEIRTGFPAGYGTGVNKTVPVFTSEKLAQDYLDNLGPTFLEIYRVSGPYPNFENLKAGIGYWVGYGYQFRGENGFNMFVRKT